MASVLFGLYHEMLEEKNKALLEAEGDDTAGGEETAPAEAPAEDAGADNADNFDIDATLDDNDGTEDPNATGDTADVDAGDTADLGGDETTGSTTDNGATEDEVNDDNTDIFNSLSAEEQAMKIRELKLLYQSLYSSCDEILERINNLKVDEENLSIVNRLGYAMYDLKRYIADYLTYSFPKMSFIENDIAFNRFLMIIKSITNILDKFNKKISKEE